MKIKVTMIMEVEDTDNFEEAKQVFYEWNDAEFLQATYEAEVTVEETENA